MKNVFALPCPPSSHPVMGRLQRGACAGLAVAALALWPALAAANAFTASAIGNVPMQVQDDTPLLPDLNPEGVVAVFQQACVLNSGQSAAVVDWALSRDFAPTDPMRGADTMLDGQAGTVLVAPGTEGRVLLAVTANQCAVWAESTSGPRLRSAMAAYVGKLGSQGNKARLVANRSLQRAGAWRNQMQWSYRAAGGSQDLGLSAVTTLTNSRGTQVLWMAPVTKPAAYAPDGVPH